MNCPPSRGSPGGPWAPLVAPVTRAVHSQDGFHLVHKEHLGQTRAQELSVEWRWTPPAPGLQTPTCLRAVGAKTTADTGLPLPPAQPPAGPPSAPPRGQPQCPGANHSARGGDGPWRDAQAPPRAAHGNPLGRWAARPPTNQPSVPPGAARRHHAGSVSPPTPAGLCRLAPPRRAQPQTWASSARPRTCSPEGRVLKQKRSPVLELPVSPSSPSPLSRTQALGLPGRTLPACSSVCLSVRLLPSMHRMPQAVTVTGRGWMTLRAVRATQG